jgi:hypothetical protein
VEESKLLDSIPALCSNKYLNRTGLDQFSERKTRRSLDIGCIKESKGLQTVVNLNSKLIIWELLRSHMRLTQECTSLRYRSMLDTVILKLQFFTTRLTKNKLTASLLLQSIQWRKNRWKKRTDLIWREEMQKPMRSKYLVVWSWTFNDLF